MSLVIHTCVEKKEGENTNVKCDAKDDCLKQMSPKYRKDQKIEVVLLLM